MAAIGSIRKRAPLLVGVIAFAIIGFLMMDAVSNNPQVFGAGPQQLAEVNGEELDSRVFYSMIDENEIKYQRNRGEGYQLTEQDQNNIRVQTWNQMIEEQLYAQKYEELGLNVSDDEMIELTIGNNAHPSIQGVQAFQDPATGQFDRQLVVNFLNQLPQLEPTQQDAWKFFVDDLERSYTEEKYNNLVGKAFYIPKWMGEIQYADEQSRVSFNYITLPYTSISDSSIVIEDKDLQAYLNENIGEYTKNADATRDIAYRMFPIVPSKQDSFLAKEDLDDLVPGFATAADDSTYLHRHTEPENRFYRYYIRSNELTEQNIVPAEFADTIFGLDTGVVFGPYIHNQRWAYTKVSDRKLIPDSVECRHVLFKIFEATTQEEYDRKIELADSLFARLDTFGDDFNAIARAFSEGPSAVDGGELGWAKPGDMVPQFNNAIFFRGLESGVMKVVTEFGLHLVEVTDGRATTPAVVLSNLTNNIYVSQQTNNDIRQTASLFAGNNRSNDDFETALQTVPNLFKGEQVLSDSKGGNIPLMEGNARSLVKWAFSSETGDVSEVFKVGNNFVVAKVTKAVEEGNPTIESFRDVLYQAVLKEKKAAQLIEQAQGGMAGNLQETAQALSLSVNNSVGTTFANPFIGGASNEPSVVGAAMATETGQMFGPIEGNNGVYVIEVQEKPALETFDETQVNDKISLLQRTAAGKVGRIKQALKDQADIEDNSLLYF